jgi:hypothetical protein
MVSPLRKVFELSQSSDVTDGDAPSVTDEEVFNDDDSDDADMTSVPSRTVGKIQPFREECEDFNVNNECILDGSISGAVTPVASLLLTAKKIDLELIPSEGGVDSNYVLFDSAGDTYDDGARLQAMMMYDGCGEDYESITAIISHEELDGTSDDSEKSGHHEELIDASLQNMENSSNPLLPVLHDIQYDDDCYEDDSENFAAFANHGDVDSSSHGDDCESNDSEYDIENHNENNLNDENISVLTLVNQNGNNKNIDNGFIDDNDSEDGNYGTNISDLTTINRFNNAVNHSSSSMTLHDEVDADIDIMIARGKNT